MQAMLRTEHIKCLDGLRGLAALWVVLYHALLLSGSPVPTLLKGGLAVDLFIMISGFLMVFQYVQREEREPWDRPSTWMRFWTRRFFRIAPLYYVMLTLVLLLGPWLGQAREIIAAAAPNSDTDPSRYLDRGWDNILAHLTFVFGFLPHYHFRTALPDWSIGLEMSFYLAFPFLMLMFRRFGGALAAIGLTCVCVAFWIVAHDFVDRFDQPTLLLIKLPMFLAGMLIAVALGRPKEHAAPLLGLAILLAGLPTGLGNDPLLLAGRLGLATLFALLIHGPRFARIADRVAIPNAVLGSRPAEFLGNISYGVYLVHLPVLLLVMAVLTQEGFDVMTRFVVGSVVTCTITYGVAYALYLIVEKPGIEAGRRILSQHRSLRV